jgi:acetyl-CoA acetyltransferase
MERVAIIGVAQTKYQRENPASHAEMAYEVTCKALEDAGLTIQGSSRVVLEQQVEKRKSTDGNRRRNRDRNSGSAYLLSLLLVR